MNKNYLTLRRFCLDCSRNNVERFADWSVPIREKTYEENPIQGYIDVCHDHLKTKTEYQISAKCAINRNVSKYQLDS